MHIIKQVEIVMKFEYKFAITLVKVKLRTCLLIKKLLI